MATSIRQGSFSFPQLTGAIPPSDRATMDAAIQELQAHKDAWVATTPRARIALLQRMSHDMWRIAPRWVEACMRAKQIAPSDLAAGEEWTLGPYPILRHLRLLRESLADIAVGRRPHIPGGITTRPDGQVVARVFPANAYDKLFYGGLRAEAWMQPGVRAASLAETQAEVYFGTPPAGKVALVLGAGNVASITVTDILYKLFNEDQVVVLKSNPVNAYLGPLIADACRALIEGGFLRVVYGGVEEGAYLCGHPGVDEIHITGSDKTFDAIVFGSGPDGARRKATNAPLLTKRITGELGNVSPVIIVPGPWTARDLAYQGEHIASMLTTNAGFNCNATRVLITAANWDRRDALLQRLRATLGAIPPRAAFYPGAGARMDSFARAHPATERIGTATGDQLPWALIPGVDASAVDDICFTTEAFCGLFAETALTATDIPEYIERAVAFCHDTLWGSLNVTLLVHPASLRDAAVRTALDRAVRDLRYGTVAVNYWAAVAFLLGSTPWGAYPGHALNDIQSGTGSVHNTLLFGAAQKAVLRAPFRAVPTPPWFATRGRSATAVFSRLAAFEAGPSPLKVPGIVIPALRG